MKLPVGCLLAACLTTSVFSEVIFNNFGPNDSYDDGTAAGITWDILSQGAAENVGVGQATPFQVTGANYSLSSVTLAIGYPFGFNNLSISIYEDGGGLPSGSWLETLVSHPNNINGPSQIVTYSSSLEPILNAGQSYWLVVQPVDLNLVNGNDNAGYSWFWSGTTGYQGYRDFNFATEDWNAWQVSASDLVSVFRIEGTPVPEPSAWALSILGAAGWFLQNRWREPRRKERS